tara:strand:+ start:3441 stop:3668 length:228 start_codon:yes stop_codon:yes gene_type:complete
VIKTTGDISLVLDTKYEEKWLTIRHKKRQATYITPLRPSTLAAFPPWGNSTGAGCVGLAGCKYKVNELQTQCFLN